MKNETIQVSGDGEAWTTVTTGALQKKPDDWTEFKFPAVSVKRVKLIAVSPQKPGEPAASFAEVEQLGVK